MNRARNGHARQEPKRIRGRVGLWLLMVVVAVAAVLVLGREALHGAEDRAAPESYFGLSPTRTASGNFIPAFDLGNSDYCGHCHTEIFQEWNASVHHFSSFNNPIYRAVALDTKARKGNEALKFCAGCHDPLPLLSGEEDRLDPEGWSANAGITCLACHRIIDVHGGNGAYVVASPILHPFSLTDNPILQQVHGLLVRATPWAHRAAMAKPLHKTPEFCATCHTLEVPRALNGVSDVVLQDEYGQWHRSRFAGRARGGHVEPRRTCTDCHMPLVPSKDPAAKQGVVRSHRFAAANSAIPLLNRDERQLQAVTAFLADRQIGLAFTGVRRNADPRFTDARSTRIAAGDNLQVSLIVSNHGVGHSFPGGTVDSNEAWLQIEARDSRGTLLYRTGSLDGQGELPPQAVRFGNVLVDRYGNPTDRRTATTEAIAVADEYLIGPDSSRVVKFGFKVPGDAKLPVTLVARLNWRKYSPEFMRWVFKGKTVPDLPVTPMADAVLALESREK